MDRREMYILDFTHPIKSPQTIDYQLDQAFWSMLVQDEILSGDVSATLTVEPIQGLYKVTFDFSGSVTVSCDRCLSPVEVNVDTVYEVSFELGEKLDDEDDKIIILNSQDPKYNVADLMYEMVSISLPLQRMHDIKDCDPEMVKYLVANAPDTSTQMQTEDPMWADLRNALATKK